jgi:gamma-butyrobetaine dioxygenase
VSQSIRSPLGEVAIEARSIALRWPDGRRDVVPFTWLRDSCACPACRHPASGQRLLEPAAIPHDIHPAEAHLDGDDLLVVWAPDRHLRLDA